MSRTGRRLKFAEILIAGVALVISVVALMYTHRQTRASAATTEEALRLAKEANDIALGRAVEYPELRASGPSALMLQQIDSIRNSEYSVEIENRGAIPVGAVQVAIRGISGLTYSAGDFRSAYRGEFSELRETILFDEQLAPGDRVNIKILTLLLRYLRSLDLRLTDGVQYTSVVEIRFLARKGANDLPIRSLTRENEMRVSISFLPETLRTKEVAAIVQTRKPSHHFYSGTSPRLQPSGY